MASPSYTGCGTANELLALEELIMEVYIQRRFSLSALPALTRSYSMASTSSKVPSPAGPEQRPAPSEAPAARSRLGKLKQEGISSKWPFLMSEPPGSSRAQPLREAPAWKKNNNNNNNNCLLSVGKNQESFQGLGVSSCLEMEARGKVRAGFLPKHLISSQTHCNILLLHLLERASARGPTPRSKKLQLNLI